METFADTSFFVALANRQDPARAKALGFARQFTGTIVTTEAVLIELGNFLSMTARRHLFVQAITLVQNDPRLSVLPVDHLLFERGFRLFSQRPDKEWSMTDCISFVVMQDRGLTDALTGDHHFEQAGFTALLK